MNQSWHNICKLTIVHFMAYPQCLMGEGPILETVTRIAEDDFFDGVEIGWIKDPSVRRAVKGVLETGHLVYTFGAQPAVLTQKLDLNSRAPEARARAVTELKARIDEAHEVGAKRLAFLSGPDPGPEHRGEAKELLIDSLRQLCAYARDWGVGITLETFDRTVDKKALIGPSNEAAAVAAAVKEDFPDFGLMYDLSHQPLLDEEALPALTLLKDHLVHVHVGNCVKDPAHPAYGDQHPRFGLPGGENDVPELVDFLHALFEIGYLKETTDGPLPIIGFEVRPLQGEASEVVIANAKRVWREAWARL